MADSKKNSFSAKRWAANILALMAMLVAVHFWQTRDSASGVAPDLEVLTLNQQLINLQQMDKPVLVYFWATWCPICGFEEGTIQSLSKDYPVITVALQSGDDETLKNYLKANDLNFTVINDDDGEISGQWGVRGVPASFIIDVDNKISHRSVGYTTEIGLRLRLWLAEE